MNLNETHAVAICHKRITTTPLIRLNSPLINCNIFILFVSRYSKWPFCGSFPPSLCMLFLIAHKFFKGTPRRSILDLIF
jgi:hypothetical protein